MVYKTLQKVSDYCQLLDKSKYPATTTQSGVIFTNNGDGTITLNGTSTSSTYYVVKLDISCKDNHKYLVKGCPSGGGYSSYRLTTNVYGDGKKVAEFTDIGSGNISNALLGSYTINIAIDIYRKITFSNLVFKPQLFDLTEMFGAGNEPTTVAEFREKFPNELYDYKPYSFLSSYKTLEKVSDYCQLLDKSKYPATTTYNGVTFTNNGDGTITLNGTAIERKLFYICSAPAIKGHKYLLSGCPEGGTYSKFLLETSWGGDFGPGIITTLKRDITSGNCYITVNKDFVCSNLTFKPQLFDLTEMFGAGNEPTTVAEFREKFPNELYDYKPYSIITSYKKSLVCTTKNLFDKTAVYTQGYDFNYCKLIETTDNGWVVKGNVGGNPGSQYNTSGWFAPLSYAEKYNPEKCISLKAGDIVTISAYYTVLENNATTKAGIYIGGTELKAVVSITLPEVGVRTRFSQKYTISKDGIYRPVFTLNSSKILIENIQVEYGATPTEYHSYGYL